VSDVNGKILAKNGKKIGGEEALAELAKELGLIAKHLFPLDPTNLEERDRLLECQAVIELATTGATREHLADCAGQAIPTAIMAVEDNTDQLIAKAMFALSENYRGKRIWQRKELLEETEHILRYTWDDRRGKVLHSVARMLRHPKKAASDINVPPRPPDSSRLEGVALQAQRAAILHYAGLATLFAQEFDQKSQDESAKLRTPSRAYFFNAYIGLLYGPWFEMTSAPTGKLTLRQAYTDELDKTTITHAGRLGNTLDGAAPIGPTSNIEDRAIRALHFMTQAEVESSTSYSTVLAFNELLPNVDAHRWLDQETLALIDVQPRLMDVYDRWCWWLRDSLGNDEGRKEVECIAGASGALSVLLGERSGVRVAIQTAARTLAHKAIATYYDTPDWQPLSDGRSLRQEADIYFDTRGLALAASY
jgi:hypothetical protein